VLVESHMCVRGFDVGLNGVNICIKVSQEREAYGKQANQGRANAAVYAVTSAGACLHVTANNVRTIRWGCPSKLFSMGRGDHSVRSEYQRPARITKFNADFKT
jgi:hypothetical protein